MALSEHEKVKPFCHKWSRKMTAGLFWVMIDKDLVITSLVLPYLQLSWYSLWRINAFALFSYVFSHLVSWLTNTHQVSANDKGEVPGHALDAFPGRFVVVFPLWHDVLSSSCFYRRTFFFCLFSFFYASELKPELKICVAHIYIYYMYRSTYYYLQHMHIFIYQRALNVH